jgi:hypothetical protein
VFTEDIMYDPIFPLYYYKFFCLAEMFNKFDIIFRQEHKTNKPGISIGFDSEPRHQTPKQYIILLIISSCKQQQHVQLFSLAETNLTLNFRLFYLFRIVQNLPKSRNFRANRILQKNFFFFKKFKKI